MRSWSRHRPGAPIVTRTVTSGKIRWAAPALAVKDTDSEIAFYLPPGTTNKVTAGSRGPIDPNTGERLARPSGSRELDLRTELLTGEWELVDKKTQGRGRLVVATPGDWFSVYLDPDRTGGGFAPRYINIERPLTRSRLGFDADDLCLDIVVDLDLRWELKDEDDYNDRVKLGLYSNDERSQIERATDQAVALIEGGSFPFDGSLSGWRPDPAWSESVLPIGWDSLE